MTLERFNITKCAVSNKLFYKTIQLHEIQQQCMTGAVHFWITRLDIFHTSLQTAAICASSMHVSVTTSVSEPPARYSITTKSSSPTRKLHNTHSLVVTSHCNKTTGETITNLSYMANVRQKNITYTTKNKGKFLKKSITCSQLMYLSKKLTILGFFSSFITRISLIISSFLGCFCRLICLMAT